MYRFMIDEDIFDDVFELYSKAQYIKAFGKPPPKGTSTTDNEIEVWRVDPTTGFNC